MTDNEALMGLDLALTACPRKGCTYCRCLEHARNAIRDRSELVKELERLGMRSGWLPELAEVARRAMDGADSSRTGCTSK